jgi:hypothetical protein
VGPLAIIPLPKKTFVGGSLELGFCSVRHSAISEQEFDFQEHLCRDKNTHVNNNATCNFITQLTLILVRISPNACRPSTNLPALNHVAHHSQQWVTPELGLNSTRVKGFLTRLMVHRQQERLCHMCQIKLTTYSPSFPTCLYHPRKCASSLLNSPSVASLPFRASTTCRTGSLRAM